MSWRMVGGGVLFIVNRYQTRFRPSFASEVPTLDTLKVAAAIDQQTHTHKPRSSLVNEFGSWFAAEGIDVLMCSLPIATCQFFSRLNRSVLLYQFQQHEYLTKSAQDYRYWRDELKTIVASTSHIFAANNVYDVMHTYHYTGILPVLVVSVPTYVHVLREESVAKHSTNLLFAKHIERTWPGFRAIAAELCRLGSIERVDAVLGEYYELEQLAEYRAAIFVPYHKSTMQMLEVYQMGLPMFFPSLDFLTSLELRFSMMALRVLWREIPNSSVENSFNFDPTSRDDESSVRFWLQFADFYQLPHIQYYGSWTQLAEILRQCDTTLVSRLMLLHNKQRLFASASAWSHILEALEPKQKS